MWPARVPRTTIRAWYTRNATTRMSTTPDSVRFGRNGRDRKNGAKLYVNAAIPGTSGRERCSMEGVYDSHASISLPVTQIFRVDRVGSERFGSRENGRVPIGNRESLGLLDRNPH